MGFEFGGFEAHFLDFLFGEFSCGVFVEGVGAADVAAGEALESLVDEGFFSLLGGSDWAS